VNDVALAQQAADDRDRAAARAGSMESPCDIFLRYLVVLRLAGRKIRDRATGPTEQHFLIHRSSFPKLRTPMRGKANALAGQCAFQLCRNSPTWMTASRHGAAEHRTMVVNQVFRRGRIARSRPPIG
jgi:hypothetical protein